MEKKYGYCNLSIIPIRKSPDHRSEMVSQLIFGETFIVIETHENWLKIETTHDNYSGWVHFLQTICISNDEFTKISHFKTIVINNHNSKIFNVTDNFYIPLPIGSTIFISPENTYTIGSKRYSYETETNVMNYQQKSIIEHADSFLGSPYLWGGRTRYGIDCSGFTQIIFRLNGINIPRDAYQQASMGETISFIDQAEKGDLLFFGNEENSITHVGIYLSNRQIIHASGLVKTEIVDQYGIYCPHIRKYTHQLRLIKRLTF